MQCHQWSPTGSVLGLLLFLIVINDIAQDLNSNTRLFAEDALLYHSIHSREDHIWMQEDLDTLAHWARTWCIEFNVTKSYTMHIMTNSSPKAGSLHPLLDEWQISGTCSEHQVSWHHYQRTAELGTAHQCHCSQSPPAVGLSGHNLHSCPQLLWETAYKTIVRPAIEFASPIWDPSSDRDIRRLNAVQRHAARFVTGNPRKRHIDHLPQRDYDDVSVT